MTKRFRFEAAHCLPHLPEGHKCRRPHGHGYQVVLHLVADELDARGFVLDYGELDPVKAWIDAELDHRDLNEVLPLSTTAEHIARWVHLVVTTELLAEQLQDGRVQLERVVVHETDNTTAEYVHAAAGGER